MTVEERLKQAQAQLAYWENQAREAERQVWMWRGAVEALLGVQDAVQADEEVGEEESAG